MRSPAFKVLIGGLCLALAFAACGKKTLRRLRLRRGEDPLASPSSPRGRPTSSGSPSTPAPSGRPGSSASRSSGKGPQKEDDRAQQITVVEDFISRGVDGIVLAPLDDRALMRPVQDAVREKIPVVIIDSALQGSDYVSYVATDNYKGGVLAARRLGELLGGKGRIFLIRYQEGSASTIQREAGFYDTITKEFPGLVLLVQDQYAGATTETAYQLAENLISRFPDVEGVFAPNESSTFGTLRALQEIPARGQGRLRRLRQLAQARPGPPRRPHPGPGPPEPGQDGLSRRQDHRRPPPRRARREGHRHGRRPGHAENMDAPEIRTLLSPDLSLIDD